MDGPYEGTSGLRVGRGVQNDPKKSSDMVGRGGGRKSSKIVELHLWTFPDRFVQYVRDCL